MNPFTYKGRQRRLPELVLRLNADLPLVQQGGPKLNTPELREDFHDCDAVGWRKHGVYEGAPCRGEPYARWT